MIENNSAQSKNDDLSLLNYLLEKLYEGDIIIN